jgi:hypothetical protein
VSDSDCPLITSLQLWHLQCTMPGDMPDCAASAESTFPDLYESGILELQDGLEKGHFTSVDLVKVNSSKLWSI